MKVEHLREKLLLGAVTMAVGFFGLLLALYYWYEGPNVVYLLGPVARWVAGIGGIGALMMGTSLVSEVFVTRKMMRGGYELRTKMADLEKRLSKRANESLAPQAAQTPS